MADKRKLNSDIDRTLKRVQEGRIAFQEILDKYDSSTNQTQREKYESDLKKEIKKLQRLRDQIKTWLTSNEIKDKKGLLDARKFIESDMERFKVIEKETKTKAYSKEGLSTAEMKKDPQLKERLELDEWLKQSIAALKSSCEKYEFEIESLSSTCKKKRIDKEKQTAIEDKRNRLEICNFHIEKLETTMRLLDNERISVEKIKQVKSGVDYVIETLDEPSLIDDKTLYDDLSLDELSELPSGITGISSQNENDGVPLSSTSSRLATGGDSSDYSTDGHCSSKSTEDGKFDFSLPHQLNSASSTSTPIKNSVANVTSVISKNSKSYKELANQTAPPQLLNSSQSKTITKSSDDLKSDKSKKKESVNSETSLNDPNLTDINEPITVEVSDQKKTPRKSPLNTPTAIPSVTTQRLNNSISQSSSVDPCSGNLTQMHPKEAAAPFRNKKLDISKASSFPIEMQSQLQKLECAFHRLPNPCDTEKARMTVCKNISNIPPYYPKESQKNTDTEEYFMKLDPNTLFFIFYYFEGTKAQYLAAKSLKKMSWRFHTKLMMWFQRHEEPKQITDEFESGTYIYYDYKTMTQRRKEDFIFHYVYLEDKDF